ncbi:MAG: lamin tail domain-containing protein [Salinivirgaceae bacterium]|jgi:hypothetical protein|nr:lamin tail domain-containing protein [Salinivirgaceae bacterium]
MKKLLLSFALMSTIFAISAQTDLIISEYIDGSGNNKALEIYNPTSQSIDLSAYIVVRFSNGESYPANLDPKTTSGGYLELEGTLEPGKCHVIVNGQTEDTEFSPACSPELQALADQLDVDYPAPTYMNGNDAIGLLKTEDGLTYTSVDIFGEIGIGSAMKNGYGWSPVKDSVLTYTDGDTEVTATISDYIVPLNTDDGSTFGPYWMAWSKDHSLIRKSNITKGVTANPDDFVISTEWDTLPAVSIGDTAWSYQDIWTNLGTHTANTTGIKSQSSFNKQIIKAYPNPVTDNRVTITSESGKIKSIEVYNIIGKIIFTDYFVSKNETEIKLNDPNEGVYMIKAEFENGAYSTQKILIK